MVQFKRNVAYVDRYSYKVIVKWIYVGQSNIYNNKCPILFFDQKTKELLIDVNQIFKYKYLNTCLMVCVCLIFNFYIFKDDIIEFIRCVFGLHDLSKQPIRMYLM